MLRLPARATLFGFFAAVAMADAPAGAAPAVLEPVPSIEPRVLADPCSAPEIKRAMSAAAAAVSSTDPGAAQKRVDAARAALMGRLSTCIPPLLGWASSATSGPVTWARVRGDISGYLSTLFRGGVLVGTRPEVAYFVTCDATTMTQSDIDKGLVICRYGVAPFKPAEFEIALVRIQTSGKDAPRRPAPPRAPRAST
jgi:hypothetical protein